MNTILTAVFSEKIVRIKFLQYSFISAQVLFILSYNLYCFLNKTNHTGFDFLLIAGCNLMFIISFVFVLYLFFGKQGILNFRVVLMLLCSLVFCVNVYLFDSFGVMVEYSKWLKRMEVKSILK